MAPRPQTRRRRDRQSKEVPLSAPFGENEGDGQDRRLRCNNSRAQRNATSLWCTRARSCCLGPLSAARAAHRPGFPALGPGDSHGSARAPLEPTHRGSATLIYIAYQSGAPLSQMLISGSSAEYARVRRPDHGRKEEQEHGDHLDSSRNFRPCRRESGGRDEGSRTHKLGGGSR